MCFNKEEGTQLEQLLDKYGLNVRVYNNEDGSQEFTLYQDIMSADSLGEVLAWLIMEFEDK